MNQSADITGSMNITGNQTVIMAAGGLEYFTRLLYVYGIPVICVFGIVGNIVSLKIFVCSCFWRMSSSLYIAAINISDTSFLILLLLSYLANGRVGINYGRSPVWCHVMIYLTYVFSFLSTWHVVLIMINRYIVVCHSLRWASKRRSEIAAGIVTTFGCLLYTHTFFTTEVYGDSCSTQYTPFMLSILQAVVYTDTAITFVIPFSLIFLLNIIIIASIHRFQLQRRVDQNENSPASRMLSTTQLRLTKTFILVSVITLVTNVPSHVIRFYIIHAAGSIPVYNTVILIHIQQMCQILYYMNYAVNFLLYCAANTAFRKHLVCSQRHLFGHP